MIDYNIDDALDHSCEKAFRCCCCCCCCRCCGCHDEGRVAWLPQGVILYGPPGTGKTLLARAVAHHTECQFIRVSGSELVQKYIGEGARMVRELFVMARQHAPSIIFMDEVDSIGGTRMEGGKGGDSEVQRTMMELLNQLDGFEPTNQIKVLMATNRLDILDPALLRPGRIDRKIEFPNPDEDVRVVSCRVVCLCVSMVRCVLSVCFSFCVDKRVNLKFSR
jgi:26S proteasome regulatory subunit T6